MADCSGSRKNPAEWRIKLGSEQGLCPDCKQWRAVNSTGVLRWHKRPK